MQGIKNKVTKFMRNNRHQPGFTLIEMVVVIAIIVLLLIIIAPNLNRQKNNAQNRTNDAFKTTLQTQVELYENENPDKEITFDDLHAKGYLTEDQYKKVKDYHLTSDNTVVKNATN